MPINAGPKYFKAEERYLSAKTREEKIVALEEMIRELPKHKGTQKLLGQLKKRLARLKKETSVRAKAKPKFIIRKEGAAQICIVGPTNSGKSSLINALTNAKVEIGDYPYTTKLPEVGMMDYAGVGIQLVEIPPTFTPDVISIVRTCDLVLFLLDGSKDLMKQLKKLAKIMEENGLEYKEILIVANKADNWAEANKDQNVLRVSTKTGEGVAELKDKIWSRLGLIRIYTKSTKAEKSERPLTLKKGSTVKDVVKEVHKSMLKNFKFARVFNKTKYSGRKVGLDYILSDLDVVEIHSG